VGTDVIVLNGGSSSGKSSLARRLQVLLGSAWLTLGIDDLVQALPGGDDLDGVQAGIEFGADGSITVGDEFRRAEAAWYRGLSAMARGGTGLILDEVFLGARASQERVAAALADNGVVWVGVRCASEVAEARERGRGDRIAGMARRQAEAVHKGVVYDLVVDTTAASALDCAQAVLAYLAEASR
jgi:chloramphenicol 3-O phosphotransferase